MEKIKMMMAKDRFSIDTVGIELLEITPGYAKARLLIRDKHLNGLGTVQGGAIFTLADLTLAAAANSYGRAAVLINANISYFKAVATGTLTAEAAEESLNFKVAAYTVRVTSQDNELVALMQATVYRKKETLESLL